MIRFRGKHEDKLQLLARKQFGHRNHIRGYHQEQNLRKSRFAEAIIGTPPPNIKVRAILIQIRRAPVMIRAIQNIRASRSRICSHRLRKVFVATRALRIEKTLPWRGAHENGNFNLWHVLAPGFRWLLLRPNNISREDSFRWSSFLKFGLV